jgi:hypothetical protein
MSQAIQQQKWKIMKTKFKYSFGTLVEDVDTGVRLFVVGHYYDKDNTPLYALSPKKDDVFTHYGSESNEYELGGYTEEQLCSVENKTTLI